MGKLGKAVLLFVVAAVVLLILTFGLTSAFAADLRVGADVVSGHIWRGQVIGSDRAMAIQPSASLVAGNLSLVVRANSYLQDRDALGGVTEMHIIAEQGFALAQGPDIYIGYRHDFYAQAAGENTASEARARLSLPAPLSPQIGVHYNFSDGERWGYDWYVVLSGTTQVCGADVSARLGLSDADGWMDFHDAEVRVARTIPLKHIDATPFVRGIISAYDSYYWILGASFTLR